MQQPSSREGDWGEKAEKEIGENHPRILINRAKKKKTYNTPTKPAADGEGGKSDLQSIFHHRATMNWGKLVHDLSSSALGHLMGEGGQPGKPGRQRHTTFADPIRLKGNSCNRSVIGRETIRQNEGEGKRSKRREA